MFSQRVLPPCARGTTWSYVSLPSGNFFPQYWQRKSSRVATLMRENFTPRLLRTARSRRTTAGILIVKVTDRMSSSYSSTTSTFPSKSIVIARCQLTTRCG